MDIFDLIELVERGSKGSVRIVRRFPNGQIKIIHEVNNQPRLHTSTEEELVNSYGSSLEKMAYERGYL